MAKHLGVLLGNFFVVNGLILTKKLAIRAHWFKRKLCSAKLSINCLIVGWLITESFAVRMEVRSPNLDVCEATQVQIGFSSN